MILPTGSLGGKRQIDRRPWVAGGTVRGPRLSTPRDFVDHRCRTRSHGVPSTRGPWPATHCRRPLRRLSSAHATKATEPLELPVRSGRAGRPSSVWLGGFAILGDPRFADPTEDTGIHDEPTA